MSSGVIREVPKRARSVELRIRGIMSCPLMRPSEPAAHDVSSKLSTASTRTLLPTITTGTDSPECMTSSEPPEGVASVSYTHLRAHETRHDLVCRLLLEKKKKKKQIKISIT